MQLVCQNMVAYFLNILHFLVARARDEKSGGHDPETSKVFPREHTKQETV